MRIDHRSLLGYSALAVFAVGLTTNVMTAFISGEIKGPLVSIVNILGIVGLASWFWFWIEAVRFGRSTRGNGLIAAAFLCWAVGHVVLELPLLLSFFPVSPSWMFDATSLLDIPGVVLRAIWPLLLAFGLRRTEAVGRPIVLSATIWGVAHLVLWLARSTAFRSDNDGLAFSVLKFASGYPLAILMFVFLCLLAWKCLSTASPEAIAQG